MNTNLRNFAIWVVIVLSIVALVNLFQSNQMSGRRASEISYSEMLSGVDSGAITEVEIRGHRISGMDRNKNATFTTVAPDDPNLIERLNRKGVKITARQSEDEAPTIFSVLMNWFPMLLLVGVWFFFMRQMQSGGGRAMGFGKSKAKLLTERQGRVTKLRSICRKSSSSCAIPANSSAWADASRAVRCWLARRAPVKP
jgi:cell division protease FtsH